jgi:predicted kinase
VVAFGGTIASGKSTLAERVGLELAAPIVDSDRIRKHLAGRQPLDAISAPAFTGSYSPEASERVHAELCRRAGIVLGSGRPILIDASFRTAAQRASVRALAQAHHVPFYFVECRAPAALRKGRLLERARGASVSDGRLEIADAFDRAFEPVTELSSAEHVRLDTAQDLAANVARLRQLIGFGSAASPVA